MKNLWLIDANPILRYLLNDIPEQADETEQKIKEGAYTLPEVLSEVIYVLIKVYKAPKNIVCDSLLRVLELIQVNDKDMILYAFDLFRNYSLDFVDCILIAHNHLAHEKVFSFDKKLNNKLK